MKKKIEAPAAVPEPPPEVIDLAARAAALKKIVATAKKRGRKQYRIILREWKAGTCEDFAITFGRDGTKFPGPRDRKMYAGSLAGEWSRRGEDAAKRIWWIRSRGFDDILTFSHLPGTPEQQRTEHFRSQLRHYWFCLWCCRAFRRIEREEPEPAPLPAKSLFG